MSEVRTRIAPSPTGSPHVGTLYMGLFNRAFAHKHGGQFVVRIEDTDATRSRPEYEEQILESLRWAGLTWDEGPDVGGPHAPYRQSDRSEIYGKYAAELIDKGAAYRAFDTAEELAERRAAAKAAGNHDTGYDRRDRDMDPAETQRRLAAGQPFVVRLAVPREGKVVVKDLLREKPIEVDCADIDDQILLKSDGLPTYHLACMVDDHLMGITHVIRGEEWLNSLPKHALIYRAFGWEEPTWVHMPLLLNPDGTKLSKRKNPTSITFYRDAGFLPEALCNYLCQMGWSQPDGEEKFTPDDFQQAIDLERISLGGAVFDQTKLANLCGQYIRGSGEDELFRRLKEWRFSDDYLRSLLPLMHERMETLGDFLPRTHAFLRRQVAHDPAALAPRGRDLDDLPPAYQTLMWALDEHLDLDREAARRACEKTAAFWEWKLRDITGIGFRALFGEPVGPPLFESIELMGRDMTRDRLRQAQAAAGGLSKKKAAKLEKRWAGFSWAPEG